MMMVTVSAFIRVGLVCRSWLILRNKGFSIMEILSNSSLRKEKDQIFINSIRWFKGLFRKIVKNDIIQFVELCRCFIQK